MSFDIHVERIKLVRTGILHIGLVAPQKILLLHSLSVHKAIYLLAVIIINFLFHIIFLKILLMVNIYMLDELLPLQLGLLNLKHYMLIHLSRFKKCEVVSYLAYLLIIHDPVP